MLKSKQKSYLKALANTKRAVFQIGYSNISDNMIKDINNYVSKNELVKINVLDTVTLEMEEIGDIFAEQGFEVVQIIGKVIVLYKKSKKAKDPIILPQ